MKKVVIAISAVLLGVIGLVGAAVLATTNVDAATTYPPIIENLAKAFNLDPEKVKTVFEQTRVQNHEERLSKLVEDGKITEAQKDQLLKFWTQLDSKREELREQGLEPEEIHDQLKPLHEEMKEWIEEQGLEDVMPKPGMMIRKRMRD